MFKNRSVMVVVMLALVAVLALAACASPVSAQGGPQGGAGRAGASGTGRGRGAGGAAYGQGSAALENSLDEMPMTDLSESEAQGILYMREEEKLARDVYLELYEQWGMQVFNNIAGSESTHMDAVKTLLERYNLDDPAEGLGAGEFSDQDLQALYDQLVAQGSQSLEDALNVGAAIEEIDILDLIEYAEQTDKADILMVYDNLKRGSETHLRAFVSALERQGETYEPGTLSTEAFDEILEADGTRGGGQGGWGAQGRSGASSTSSSQRGGTGRGGRSR